MTGSTPEQGGSFSAQNGLIPSAMSWIRRAVVVIALLPFACKFPIIDIEGGPKIEAVTLAEVGLDQGAIAPEVERCEDFYQYACGGWIAKTKIPDDKPKWTRSFDEIAKKSAGDLRTILERAAEGGEDAEAQQLGGFYKACMDEASIETAGLGTIRELLRAAANINRSRDITQATLLFHQHRIWPLFRIGAEVDAKNPSQVIAYVDQAGLGLPDPAFYSSDDPEKKRIREAYRAHVERMMNLFDSRRGAAERAADHVIEIETKIAAISRSSADRQAPELKYHPLEKDQLSVLAKDFLWDQYVAGLGYPDLAQVNVRSSTYLRGLNAVLGDVRLNEWRSYFTWHAIHSMAPWLPKRFADEHLVLTELLDGTKELSPRWKRCVASTEDLLGDLLAKAYVAEHFSKDRKTAAQGYIKKFTEALKGRLNARFDRAKWMDDATRAIYRRKLETLSYLVGYPDTWREYDFKVTDQHATNVLRGRVWSLKEELAQIGNPIDRNQFPVLPTSVSVAYDPQKNQLVFPAGILQPPFYSSEPNVPVNMGTLGALIGHKLAYGFDEQGSKYDENGKLVQPWWSDEYRREFDERTKCITDRVSQFEGVPNSEGTLREKVADLVGVSLAYDAYRSLRDGAKTVKVADGFDEDQQFFLAYAQARCTKQTEAFTMKDAVTSLQSPPEFRVNESIANIEGFSRAFGCKQVSRMNPTERCTIW